MRKKRKISMMLLLAMVSTSFYSQTLGFEGAAEDIWDEVRGAAPYIFAGIFLVSVFFNIGKVTGADRDYKAFFTGLVLWFASILVVVAIVTYLLSLSF